MNGTPFVHLGFDFGTVAGSHVSSNIAKVSKGRGDDLT